MYLSGDSRQSTARSWDGEAVMSSVPERRFPTIHSICPSIRLRRKECT